MILIDLNIPMIEPTKTFLFILLIDDSGESFIPSKLEMSIFFVE
jgi:hypothetical protein